MMGFGEKTSHKIWAAIIANGLKKNCRHIFSKTLTFYLSNDV